MEARQRRARKAVRLVRPRVRAKQSPQIGQTQPYLAAKPENKRHLSPLQVGARRRTRSNFTSLAGLEMDLWIRYRLNFLVFCERENLTNVVTDFENVSIPTVRH